MRAEHCEEGEKKGWRRRSLPPLTDGCWDAVGWRLRAEEVITVVMKSHGKVVALYMGLALRPMVRAIKNELGGVLIWSSLGASPSRRKLSTGQLQQVAHRRTEGGRTSTPSVLIMGLGCPQGAPF